MRRLQQLESLDLGSTFQQSPPILVQPNQYEMVQTQQQSFIPQQEFQSDQYYQLGINHDNAQVIVSNDQGNFVTSDINQQSPLTQKQDQLSEQSQVPQPLVQPNMLQQLQPFQTNQVQTIQAPNQQQANAPVIMPPQQMQAVMQQMQMVNIMNQQKLNQNQTQIASPQKITSLSKVETKPLNSTKIVESKSEKQMNETEIPKSVPTVGMIDLGEDEDIIENIGNDDGISKKTDDIQSKIDLLEKQIAIEEKTKNDTTSLSQIGSTQKQHLKNHNMIKQFAKQKAMETSKWFTMIEPPYNNMAQQMSMPEQQDGQVQSLGQIENMPIQVPQMSPFMISQGQMMQPQQQMIPQQYQQQPVQLIPQVVQQQTQPLQVQVPVSAPVVNPAVTPAIAQPQQPAQQIPVTPVSNPAPVEQKQAATPPQVIATVKSEKLSDDLALAHEGKHGALEGEFLTLKKKHSMIHNLKSQTMIAKQKAEIAKLKAQKALLKSNLAEEASAASETEKKKQSQMVGAQKDIHIKIGDDDESDMDSLHQSMSHRSHFDDHDINRLHRNIIGRDNDDRRDISESGSRSTHKITDLLSRLQDEIENRGVLEEKEDRILDKLQNHHSRMKDQDHYEGSQDGIQLLRNFFSGSKGIHRGHVFKKFLSILTDSDDMSMHERLNDENHYDDHRDNWNQKNYKNTIDSDRDRSFANDLSDAVHNAVVSTVRKRDDTFGPNLSDNQNHNGNHNEDHNDQNNLNDHVSNQNQNNHQINSNQNHDDKSTNNQINNHQHKDDNNDKNSNNDNINNHNDNNDKQSHTDHQKNNQDTHNDRDNKENKSNDDQNRDQDQTNHNLHQKDQNEHKEESTKDDKSKDNDHKDDKPRDDEHRDEKPKDNDHKDEPKKEEENKDKDQKYENKDSSNNSQNESKPSLVQAEYRHKKSKTQMHKKRHNSQSDDIDKEIQEKKSIKSSLEEKLKRIRKLQQEVDKEEDFSKVEVKTVAGPFSNQGFNL